jgi:hypothetical protein
MKGATLLERLSPITLLKRAHPVPKIRRKNLADFPLRSIDPIYQPEVCRASDFVPAAALTISNDTKPFRRLEQFNRVPRTPDSKPCCVLNISY